jgi:hypothetical protein
VPPHGADVPQGAAHGAEHGLQWLAQRIGAALQQVAAGAHAVSHAPVEQGANEAVPQAPVAQGAGQHAG